MEYTEEYLIKKARHCRWQAKRAKTKNDPFLYMFYCKAHFFYIKKMTERFAAAEKYWKTQELCKL